MAVAFMSWRALDNQVQGDDKRAYVSAFVYNSLTLHILSMNLLISGHLVPAGNAYRQVVEAMALALLCSGKELTVPDRFIDGKYKSNYAVRDVIKNAEKLNLIKDAVLVLNSVQEFNHQYSHPSFLTIASSIGLEKDILYVGASFDAAKMEAYKKEFASRCGCAEVFCNFVDAVKMNVAKW